MAPICSARSRAALTLRLLLLSVTHLLAGDDDQGGLNMAYAEQQQLKPSLLPLGSSWPANNLSYLTSSDSAASFCFGWRQFPNASHKFYVAVWYAGLDNAIVWVANRNNPAAGDDTLQLTSDGNLLITSFANGSHIWQTNTSSTGVSSLQILDSGNAVLLLRNNMSSSGYAWQSFSSPTDTFVPSQPFLVTQTLISRPAAYSTSLASGNFKFYIKQDLASIDNINSASVVNVWTAWSPIVLPVDAINNSAIAGQFMESGVFSLYNVSTGSAYSQLIPTDYGSIAASSSEPLVRRLTLDPDGNLRIYGWDYASRKWVVLCIGVTGLCSTMSLTPVAACGQYGVCVDAPEPACACPPAFHPTDVGDVSRGCSPDNLSVPGCPDANVSASSTVIYLVLYNTDFIANDISSSSGIGLPACQKMCDQQCSCVGVIYDKSGSATCWLKYSLTNGYSPQEQKGTRDAYIKVWNSTASPVINPPSQSPGTLAWINSSAFWSQASIQSSSPASVNTPCTCSGTSTCSPQPRRHTSTIVGVLSALSAAELFCFLLALFLLLKTNLCGRIVHHRQETPSMEHPGCRAFTHAELVQATDNFRQILGSGAFGEVLKGVLPDGREIAVKRLQASTLQGAADTHIDQFKAEIATLGRIHHLSLVRLYGYCAEGPHRLLVYEFMENGSMNSFLFEERPDHEGAQRLETMSRVQRPLLSWKTRYNICLGTARGLAYLHEDCLYCIVHCDVKPENILLDQEFYPKLGDFGVAYLFGRNETLETIGIRGTRGYLAPEWLAYLPITAKADVFSYGMVLIEIVSGRRNFRSYEQYSAVMSPSWAYRQLQSGRLEEVVDPRLRGEVSYTEADKVLRIAFLCLHQEARARPTMRNIVQMLEGSMEVPTLPQGPGSFPDQVEGVARHNWPTGPQLSTSTIYTATTGTSGFSSVLSPR